MYSNNDKGKGKKGNKFKGNNKRKSLNGARIIQGMDGNNVEVHPAYNFNPKVWRNTPDAEKDKLRNEQQEYKRRQSISAVESVMSQQQMNYQPAPHAYYPPPPPQQIALGNARGSGTSNSKSTQRENHTMMGGRNEQASYRRDGHSSIMAVHTSRRVSSSLTKRQHAFVVEEPPAGKLSRKNESDSNADTCCLGNNFLVLSMTSKTADVYPYDNSYAPLRNVPIVSGGTAYDDPDSGLTYIYWSSMNPYTMGRSYNTR